VWLGRNGFGCVGSLRLWRRAIGTAAGLFRLLALLCYTFIVQLPGKHKEAKRFEYRLQGFSVTLKFVCDPK